jgi:hypothetical protein
MRSLALWLSIGLCTPGCSAERKALKAEAKAEEALATAASAYWYAVRWNYWDVGASYYDDTEERLAWLTEQGTAPTYRYTDATLMRVEVEDPLEEANADGIWRRGRVFVQAQGYPLATQVVEKKVLNQKWFSKDEDADVWFIDSSED